MPRAFTNPVWHAKRPKLECSVTSHKQPGLKGNSWYSTPKHCALAERTAYAALTTTDRMSPKATRLLSASSQESTRLVKSRHLYGYLDRSNAQMPASGTRQCTTGSSGILPATGLLDKSTQNQVAILWREIPQTYLDLLPLVVKGRILPFCSIDLPTLDASLGRRCSRHLLFGDDSYRRGGRSRFAAAKTVFERRRNQVFGSSHERYCRVGMTFSLTLQMSRA
jgi:hypothetical protein